MKVFLVSTGFRNRYLLSTSQKPYRFQFLLFMNALHRQLRSPASTQTSSAFQLILRHARHRRHPRHWLQPAWVSDRPQNQTESDTNSEQFDGYCSSSYYSFVTVSYLSLKHFKPSGYFTYHQVALRHSNDHFLMQHKSNGFYKRAAVFTVRYEMDTRISCTLWEVFKDLNRIWMEGNRSSSERC